MPSYVALLRGINVGGKNLIRMPALKACFEANGFEDVTTYIQSGNVLFTAPASRVGRADPADRGDARARRSTTSPTVVVRNRKQMRAIVERAPEGFGSDPTKYRYDVIFLKEPLTATAAMRQRAHEPGGGRGARRNRRPLLLEARRPRPRRAG